MERGTPTRFEQLFRKTGIRPEVHEAIALLEQSADALTQLDGDPLRAVYLRQLTACIPKLLDKRINFVDAPPEVIEQAPVTVTLGPVPEHLRERERASVKQS